MISNNRGMTLFEIMVVVSIIAILAAISIPNLLRARTEGNEAGARSSLKSVSNALESYFVVNQVYPTDTNDLLNVSPPYLSINYFSGTWNGYTYTITLSGYTYAITATPVDTTNSGTFVINTGGVLSEI